MSDKTLIDLGKGKIKSDMISSHASDLFKPFKSGCLIITKNKSMSATILQVIDCYSNDTGAFASVEILTQSGTPTTNLIVFDEKNNKFILNNLQNRSEIIEVVSNDSKHN